MLRMGHIESAVYYFSRAWNSIKKFNTSGLYQHESARLRVTYHAEVLYNYATSLLHSNHPFYAMYMYRICAQYHHIGQGVTSQPFILSPYYWLHLAECCISYYDMHIAPQNKDISLKPGSDTPGSLLCLRYHITKFDSFVLILLIK